MTKIPAGLDVKFKAASRLLNQYDKFRIITHYDADGISAAAVLSKALMREDKGFHIRFVHDLEEDIDRGLPLIFTDIGAGQLERLAGFDDPVLVVDHHKVEEIVDGGESKVFINPHEFGLDGAQEVSGGTLALLVSTYLNEKNWDHSLYGLAGAAADKQDVSGFVGLNKWILDEALNKEVLDHEHGLFIDGGGLKDALLKACDPYFPGISGRRGRVERILRQWDMDPGMEVDEMTQEKERKLTSLLVLSLLKKDIPPDVINDIMGKRYESKKQGVSVDVLYKLLNACARVGQPGLGLCLCLGEKSSLEKARELRSEYRSDMVEKLKTLEDEGIQQMEYIQYFYEEKRARKGELAGLGMLYFFDQDKPAFGLSEVDEDVDISGRGTKRMIEKGLDLGKLCREIGQEFGGTGGGHDIAAGATVEKDKIDAFLRKMNDRVGDIIG